MSQTITVVTPENITVTYRLAGVASRFLAAILDLAIRLVLLLFVLAIVSRLGRIGFGIGSFFTAAGMIASFLILFAYGLFFEMLGGGRTPGKRIFGLRVIRDGGYPINFIASAIRNILLFVDFGILPLSGTVVIVLVGMPGLVSIFFSPSYKRIGDYAAGTVVIVETASTPFSMSPMSQTLHASASAYLPLIKNLDRLTIEEYRIIRRFISRRASLDIVVQASMGERLARPILEKLEIVAPVAYQAQYADVLEALEKAYAEERGIL